MERIKQFNAMEVRTLSNDYMENEEWVQIIQKDIMAEASHGIYRITLENETYPELMDADRRRRLIDYLSLKGFIVTDNPDGGKVKVSWYIVK